MRDRYFFIEFQIEDPERFSTLQRFFDALKDAREEHFAADEDEARRLDNDPAADPQWLTYLDAGAVQRFAETSDVQSEDGAVHQGLPDLTKPCVRLSHSMFHVAKH